jgi:hypothetical protein
MRLILVQKNISVRIVDGEVFTMASTDLSNSVAFPEEKVFSEEELAHGISDAYISGCASQRTSVIVRVPHPKPATTEEWYAWPDDMINAAVDLKGIFLANDSGKTLAIKLVNKLIEQQLAILERQKTSILATGQNATQAILGDVVRA